MNSNQVYIYALAANLVFAIASIGFTYYSQKFGVIWMNFIKILVASLCFLIFQNNFDYSFLSLLDISLICLSGLMGLTIGDILLLKAYTTLGASRTQILFAFQPILLGIYGYFFLNQLITSKQFIAIALIILCLIIFVHERLKKTGNWDFSSFLVAGFAILFESLSMVIVRALFEKHSQLDPMQMNSMRTIAALMGFAFIYLKMPIHFKLPWAHSKIKRDYPIVLVSFLGTFLSLFLYLKALKYAHLATFSSLGIAGPILATLAEHIYLKTYPSFHLIAAILIFILGFFFMYS